MLCEKLYVKNFKTFREIDIDLQKFNVIIGSNAAGKSNFVEIFRFFRDIANHGLDNAISLQGGVDYLRNVQIGNSENFKLRMVFSFEESLQLLLKNPKPLALEIASIEYQLELRFAKRGKGYSITNDRLEIQYKCYELKRDNKKRIRTSEEEIDEITVSIIKNDRSKPKLNVKSINDTDIEITDIFPTYMQSYLKHTSGLLIQKIVPFLPPDINFQEDIVIYDFDPKLLKKASSISGKKDLEEDGSNLAIVLNRINGNKNTKRMFSNLIQDLLPFVNDFNVERFVDKSILFKYREQFSKEYIPSFLMSDGTVNITALLCSLFFQNKPLVIIEEPERNIHPYLLSRTVNMMAEASQNKQIIVTTHNPEIIKNTQLDTIYMISRDTEGFSNIVKPSDSYVVKCFLENEIGIEEIFVQNLLGG